MENLIIDKLTKSGITKIIFKIEKRPEDNVRYINIRGSIDKAGIYMQMKASSEEEAMQKFYDYFGEMIHSNMDEDFRNIPGHMVMCGNWS